MSPRLLYGFLLLPLTLTAQSDSTFRHDTARARVLLREGLAFRDKGDYQQALARYLEAVKTMDGQKKDRVLGSSWLNIAGVYQMMGGTSMTEVYVNKGIDYSHTALDLYRDIQDTSGQVSSLNELGVLYRDKARSFNHEWYYDTAFVYYTEAIRLMELSPKAAKLRARLYNNISQVYLEHNKDYPSALDFLFKAVAANQAQNDTDALTYNYGNISHAYENEGKFQPALQYAQLMLFASLALHEPERVKNGYFQVFNVYNFFGKSDSALRYYILAADLNDSLTDIAKTTQVAELQTKYETEKKEVQIAGQRRQILWLVAASAVFAGLAVSMVLLYGRVRKQRRQIAEQSARLETMMKELHHRVKNNLQVVSSLLSLQSYDLIDDKAVAALKESQQRVEAMSMIHQRLYKNDELTTVNMREYLSDLAESLVTSYGFERDAFDLTVSARPERLDVDKALPIGLIINEMVTNALKYAYPGVSRPALDIRLDEDAKQLLVEVRDNGVGLDVAQWKRKSQSFGKQLIGALCRQLRAEQQLVVDGGTRFTLLIPKQAA